MVKHAAGVVLIAAILAAATELPVAAATAHDTLDYQCSYEFFGSQPMTAQLTWAGPSSVPVGQATPSVLIDAVATVPAAVTGALAMDGAATVEGTVDASGTVLAPEGNIGTGMELAVPRFTVPASGDMSIPAHGKTPALVFHRPGPATIVVSDNLAMHLTLRDANGNPPPVSQVDVSCTLNSGQNAQVYSFGIVAPAAPPPNSTPGKTGTAGAPGTIAPGPSTLVPSGSPSSQTSTPPSSMVVAGTAPPPVSPDQRGLARTSAEVLTLGPAGMNWWLVAAAIVVAGLGMIGGGWWLMRRRARRLPPP